MRQLNHVAAWYLMTLAWASLGHAVEVDPEAAAAARASVDELHETLLDSMKEGPALGFEGRRGRIDPVVADRFDLPLITRIVTGRHWRGLDKASRRQIVEAVGGLTVATYAARFKRYSGERFVTRAVEAGKRGRLIVRTALERVQGDPVRLDYVLRSSDGGWRIVNVIADGVSELSIKRAEYNSTLSEQGFEALLAKLESQVAQYENTVPP